MGRETEDLRAGILRRRRTCSPNAVTTQPG